MSSDVRHLSIRRMPGLAVPVNPREVARAVADDGEGLLGQRGKDKFAVFAVGQDLAGLGIDDLGQK